MESRAAFFEVMLIGLAFIISKSASSNCSVELDLRGQGYSMENARVNDQGELGTCYAHAAVKKIEALLRSRKKDCQRTQLSVFDAYVNNPYHQATPETKQAGISYLFDSGGSEAEGGMCPFLEFLAKTGVCDESYLEGNLDYNAAVSYKSKDHLLLEASIASFSVHTEEQLLRYKQDLELTEAEIQRKKADLETMIARLEGHDTLTNLEARRKSIEESYGVLSEKQEELESHVHLSVEQELQLAQIEKELERLDNEERELVRRKATEEKRLGISTIQDQITQVEPKGLGIKRRTQIKRASQILQTQEFSTCLRPDPLAKIHEAMQNSLAVFNRIDPSSLVPALRQFVNLLCKNHRIQIPDGDKYSCRKVINKKEFAQSIDIEFGKAKEQTPQPVLVRLNANVLQNTGSQGGEHTLLLTGKKSEAGKCYYLLWNSWGESCDHYYPKIKCENGVVWIEESEFLEHAKELTF